MSKLQIRISNMEGAVPVAVLHLAGEIDSNTHSDLDQRARELVDGGARNVLLDMTETNYMSSAGFRSMHKILLALKEAGGQEGGLKLLKPSDRIQGLMKAMGFDLHVEIYDDLNAAIAAY